MKRFSITSRTLRNPVLMSVVVAVAMTIGSCAKHELGIPDHGDKSTVESKRAAVNKTVQHVLRGFVTAQAGGSSQQSFAGSGSGVYSNVTMSTTTKAEPMRTMTSWSDPAEPGTVYTFSDAASSGGGLGQLSYDGKSFDYNYVLSIKVTSADATWGGIAGSGQELRAIVAIDGELESEEFILRNLAIFLVIGESAEGTFEFNFFDDGLSGDGFAIGEMLDFSDVTTPTLANMDGAKFLYTSGGHVNVSATSFEMASDAKIKDIVSGVEYILEGAVMSE
jgi:hypothetical protein